MAAEKTHCELFAKRWRGQQCTAIPVMQELLAGIVCRMDYHEASSRMASVGEKE